MHIAVAGNIGAGKTTLTKLLAKHYKWEAHFEDVVDNPYLDDFYNQSFVAIIDGEGKGQLRKITDYNGTTKIASIALIPNTKTKAPMKITKGSI